MPADRHPDGDVPGRGDGGAGPTGKKAGRGITRKEFLLLGAGVGAVIALQPWRRLGDELVSQVREDERAPPGTWRLFATTCRECPAGCGMHLMHRDGRITKAEGNPDHPVSRGGLCPRGQASLQGQYDPDRLRTALARGAGGCLEPVPLADAVARAGLRLGQAGGRVLVISDLQTGTLAEVVRRFSGAFGDEPPLFHEAFSYGPLREAHRAVFGRAEIPRYRLERCDFILSLSADFLECWVSPVEFAWQFARMHAYRDGGIGRMACVGPRLSMTGGNADDFLLVPPGADRLVAAAVLKAVIERGGARAEHAGLHGLLPQLATAAHQAEKHVPRERIGRLAERFAKARRPVALACPVGVDGPAARETATLAALLNAACGSVGEAVDFSRPHALSAAATDEDLERALSGLGDRDAVVVLCANPAYTAPHLADGLRRAGTVIRIGTMPDETAALADLVLPCDYPLESWGDYEPYAGIHGLMQPTMAPLYGTKSAGDLLLDLAAAAGRPLIPAGAGGFHELLLERWRHLAGEAGGPGPGGFESFWHESLVRGGFFESAPREARVEPMVPELRPAPSSEPAAPAPASPASPEGGPVRAEFWPWAGILLFDGRLSNRGWIQENSQRLAEITWTNWFDVHPTLARRLGLRNGDIVSARSASGEVEAPARLNEEIDPGTVAMAFGQGHTALGRNAAGRGANAFALLASPDAGRSTNAALPLVTLAKTGRSMAFATTAPTRMQHGRDLLRWIRLSVLRTMGPGEGVSLTMPLPGGYDPKRDLYPPHQYKRHRWAMAIDLHKCIGCGACQMACYAENNIPVMGEEQVRNGREMSWLRVPPYWSEDRERIGWLPLPCQHCDAAPCEPVCPVFASVHNEEGLNAQIYNRCVGTRYCNNNCPYKVRRFEWLNVEWVKPLDMQLNPEVTVRCRGVMEKCTFCIQRIHRAEYQAAIEKRPLRDGEIQPACVQSCPTRAFVFGDLLDPESEVNRIIRTDPRRYQLLQELNTKPAVFYLMRIHNDEG